MVAIDISNINKLLKNSKSSFRIQNKTTLRIKKRIGRRRNIINNPVLVLKSSSKTSSSGEANRTANLVRQYIQENHPEFVSWMYTIYNNTSGSDTSGINNLEKPVKVRLYDNPNLKIFNITIQFSRSSFGLDYGGVDSKNDCLFYTINRFVKIKENPGLWKSKITNNSVNRNDLIPVCYLDNVAEKYRINIECICEKSIYKTENIHNEKLQIKLQNNHYEPVYYINKHGDKIQNISKLSYLMKTPLREIKQKQKLEPWYYYEDGQHCENKPDFSNPKIIPVNISQFVEWNREYKTTYNDYLSVKNYTKKFGIDFNNGKNLKHIALHYLFRTISVKDPEKIETAESKLLSNIHRGGFRFSKPGKYDDVFQYDINSFYPSVLNTGLFVPFSSPLELTQDDFQKMKAGNFYYYGIYEICNINIENVPEKYESILYSILKPKKYYTHCDLYTFKKLGINFKILNGWKYVDKKQLKQVFARYVNHLYTAKQKAKQEFPLALKCIKAMISRIHGYLSEKCSQKKYIDPKKETLDINEDFQLTSLHEMNGKLLAKLTRINNIFRYSWSRPMCVFQNICRNRFINLVITEIDKGNELLYSHTDSMVLKNKAKTLEISDKLGDFKLENSGNITIENMQTKYF